MMLRVIAIVARELGVEPQTISPHTRLDELGMDSLDFVSLLQCINVEIGEIPEDQVTNLETIEDIAKAIKC
jgi:acyl carrier protein